MSASESSGPVDGRELAESAEPVRLSTLKRALAFVWGGGFFGALVFVPVGRIDWIPGWAYVGLMSVYMLATVVYLQRVNPEIIVHRTSLKKGTETWDKVWIGVFAPMFLAIYVVAGLDARFGWAPLPLWVWAIGFALFVPGGLLVLRAMGENPFFEKTVRIQSERGHHVIDTGPYGTVRHPGYVGLFGWILSTPLLLTSTWAVLPTALAVIGLVIRTALEDRTLQKKLPGYADYATRVRSRLIPGVW